MGPDQLSPSPRNRRSTLLRVGVALFVAIMVRTFLLAHFVVEGESMLSTLHSGDRVFVNKLSYRLHDPRRGDVVVLHELTGASERDLSRWHGALVAADWLEQNTGHTPNAVAGQVAGCYRLTRLGRKALRQINE